ncbi:hypothetical protein CBR_g24047 [Chara braunii]|uniref:DNA mismatch repair protein MutS core domain-containing protein n=1 Tax=Chara braunii TaxID=69332 RepID=A0A388L5L9_CHABU|nr:hypothetical protein CBR_g24047 [Chara braunii]|eukprot:GBG77600.1 hypothetical protein CBR_g24047 [Chara braunii]
MASASGSLGEQEDPKDVGGGEEQKLPELKLDARQAQGFISFFNKLPPGPEIVRFFDRRDYFTVHGDNATLVARTYYKTMTCLRQLGNPPDTLMGVSVSRSMFETIIRDLLLQRTDHIVEVYEGSGSNWRLVKTGTPGNLRSFEDVLFSSNEMEDTPVLMALYPTMERDEILLGVAFEMLSNDSAYGKYTLQQYKLDTYMRLDAAALQALNVFESRMDLNKNFSVAGLMNRTCTAGMGKRLLNRWLKQPLLDIDEINQRLDIVQTFVERVDLRQDVQKQLKRIPDLERLLRKVERRKATLFDIVKLFQVSMRLPFIKEALAQYDGESASVLKEKYINDMEEWTGPDHLGKFDGLVEAAIDLDHVNEGEYVIDPEYDPALGELRAERNKVEEQITKVYKQAISDLDLTDKTLKLDKAAQLGHVFRITKKEEPRVRKKLNMQYVTLETRKDGIKFTNANLRKLSEQFQKLTDEYEDRQRELVEKVVEVAATFLEIFEGVANLLAELDVLLGFADLSVSAPTVYVRPSITSSSEGDIILEGSRHPCVEVQEDVSFIPNDCRLVRGKSWFQIITGPNMGGKSTFIRQVGVVVLMAQVGCFVPCDRAEISVRDSIFARVGAGDCQV